MSEAILLSGGMDSTAVAWWKRPSLAITVDYGQRAARAERIASGQVCAELGIRHEIIAVDCSQLGSGDMSDGPSHLLARTTDWWPYRNQLLITLAAMRAITLSATKLIIGTVRSDGDDHLDATTEFIRRVNDLVSYQEGGLQVVAPAAELSTADLIRRSKLPPGLLAWTHSCHKADIACGDCRGCNKYLATYAELGPEYSVG
ncbi:MAG: 7-cyano-7-deazaguanine synthase [Steroidobacteraceae bacterium]|nr:7-cyano-7-deazaguanine synthase [Steroidobacteraceae bacterium]